MATSNNDSQAPKLSQKTQTTFVTLNLITQSCHAILNTTFTAPDPKPDWFDDLNSELDVAKTVAGYWINQLGPEITSGVPMQVINYGITYDSLSGEIQKIASAHPTASGADNEYVKQVHELVSALYSSVQEIIKNADTASSQLEAWGKKIQAAHDALSSGIVNIQSAETALESDINKMNEAIKQLNEAISEENMVIACSGGGIALGLFLTVIGIALAPETGGTSYYLLAGFGGLLTVGGSVTWGVMQDKIDKQFNEIAKDQQELSSEAQQLVALKGLASASSQAIAYLSNASSALSDFRTSWGMFEGELKGVLDKLEEAKENLSVIVSDSFTIAAQTEWQDATKFAQSLAYAKVEFPAKDMPMSSTTQKAA